MRVMLQCKGLGLFFWISHSCPPLDVPGQFGSVGNTLHTHAGVLGASAFGAGDLLSFFILSRAAAAPGAVSDPGGGGRAALGGIHSLP